METKSRYEVISGLESQKRELIKERDSLGDLLKEQEKEVRTLERQKSDNIVILDRQIEDKKENVENFKESMAERKETIKELIKSVDDSLGRFSKIQEKK